MGIINISSPKSILVVVERIYLKTIVIIKRYLLTDINGEEMKRVLVNLTDAQLEELDKLTKNKVYRNRSEAVRDAVRQLLEKEKITELNKKLR